MSSTTQYVVKLPNNNNILVTIPNNSTIFRLKQEIQSQTSIPINEQKLVYNDQELVLDKTTINLPPLSTLVLTRVTPSKGTTVVSNNNVASTSSTSTTQSSPTPVIPSNTIPALPVDEEEETCSICLETYAPEYPPVTLKCKHGFHEPCIKEWCKNSRFCPLCRAPMELIDTSTNNNTMNTMNNNNIGSTTSSTTATLLSIPAAIVASVTPSIFYSWKSPATTTVTNNNTTTTTTTTTIPSSPGVATTVTTISIADSTPPSVDTMARLLNETRARIMNNPEYSLLRAAVGSFAIQFAARGARTLVNSSLAGTAVTLAGIALQNSSVLRNVASTAARSVVQGTLRDVSRIGPDILFNVANVLTTSSPATALATTALASAAISTLAPSLVSPNPVNSQQQPNYGNQPQQQQQQNTNYRNNYNTNPEPPVPQPRAFIVRCPNCQQLLHTPDAPVFRCTCGAFLSR